MRDLLSSLGFDAGGEDLARFAVSIAAEQRARWRAGAAGGHRPTRSTLIAVLGAQDTSFKQSLTDLGLDWESYWKEVSFQGAASEGEPAEPHPMLADALTRAAPLAGSVRMATPRLVGLLVLEAILMDVDISDGRNLGLALQRLANARLDWESLWKALRRHTLSIDPRERVDEPEKTVWFCQITPDRADKQDMSANNPGARLQWWSNQASLPGMMEDEPVIYWRTVGEGKAGRGGIRGVGRLVAPVVTPGDTSKWTVATRVEWYDTETVVDRDTVLKAARVKRKTWAGSILPLYYDNALAIHDMLLFVGRPGLFRRSGGAREDRVSYRPDTPVSDHDVLNRAPLAVAFARRLHDIWTVEQGLPPHVNIEGEGARNQDSSAFVLHIDAPWGGGKTSFANFISRTLNPEPGPKNGPTFLREMYPGREDMSGLFIGETHRAARKEQPLETRWPDVEARRPWIVIPYNAWQHQHVQPPWWWFWRAIRDGCRKALWAEGLREVKQSDGEYRTDENKHRGRIIAASLFLRDIRWRFLSKRVLVPFIAAFGFFAVLCLSIWAGGIEINDGKTMSQYLAFQGLLVVSGLGTLIGLYTSGVSILSDAVAPGSLGTAERDHLGVTDPLDRFRVHFQDMMRRVKRPILVVVDDLDRCDPEVVVEFMRGLQTILRSPRVAYLILGDRAWIVQAFKVVYDRMEDKELEKRQNFGMRFLEKAIQASIRLPGMKDHREPFVEAVLRGRPVKVDLTTSESTILKNEVTEARAAPIGTTPPEPDLPEHASPAMKTVARDVGRRERVLARSVDTEKVQDAVGLRLLALAEFLPSNPRDIKRIVNSISMYQDVIELTEGHSPGSEEWEKLAIGIVLTMVYPRAWSHLRADPSLLSDFLDGEKGDPTGTPREQALAELSDTKDLKSLLQNARLGEDRPIPIKNKEDIAWLRELLD